MRSADNAIEVIDVVGFNRTKWFLTDPAKNGELNPGVLVSWPLSKAG